MDARRFLKDQDDSAIAHMLRILPADDPRRRIYEQLATESDDEA